MNSNCCEQIFSDAGQQLTDQLAAMSCCGESSCCAPVTDCGEGCCAKEDVSCFHFGGWLQLGYHNEVVPNGVVASGSFNSHPDRLNVHQT